MRPPKLRINGIKVFTLTLLLTCMVFGQALMVNANFQPANQLTPSEQLLASGAKWAAQNGTSVLYINWFDNYNAHHFTDGTSWGPYWGADYLSTIKNGTIKLLEQQGFNVECSSDVPIDISKYNLVIFEAWFAIEPEDNQLVRNYLSNGGNVVIIGGVPCYFSTYCKDMWPYKTGGQNLSSLQDWFGSSLFVNTGGNAYLSVDNPFGNSLLSKNQLYHIDAYGCYALGSMSNNANVIARWADSSVFAFTHEYGKGRVYYQAATDFSESLTVPMNASNLTLSCISTTSSTAFKVEIIGNLTSNQTPMTGASILISYSVTDGNSWIDLTTVNTGSDGSFLAEWLPSATGNYLIKATFQGDATHLSDSSIVNLAVMPYSSQKSEVFSVSSNSTVTNLAFNSTSHELSFSVTGVEGTVGYINAYIEKTLIDDISDLKVYLDGTQENFNVTIQEDSYVIQFTYHHSTHLVIINLNQSQSKGILELNQATMAITGVLLVIFTLVLAVMIYAIRQFPKN